MTKKNSAVDRPSLADLRPQGVMQRVPSLLAYCSSASAVLPALAIAALLVTVSACAQTIAPAPSAASASKAASEPIAPPDAAKTAPRYSAADIERAFNFLDANKDGKISREGAAGFRNIAKHFDAADTDKDGTLSLIEFGNALNRR